MNADHAFTFTSALVLIDVSRKLGFDYTLKCQINVPALLRKYRKYVLNKSDAVRKLVGSN